MIVNESLNTKKIKDATAISKEIGYNEIAYINNNKKIIGDMPISYNNTYKFNTISDSTIYTTAYGNNKYVAITPTNIIIITEQDNIEIVSSIFNDIGTLCFGNGIFVYIQENGEIYYSYDALNWTYTTTLTAGWFYDDWHTSCIIYDEKNKAFIASYGQGGSIGGTSYNNYYSYDGIIWERIEQAYGGGDEDCQIEGFLIDINGEILAVSWSGKIKNLNHSDIGHLNLINRNGYVEPYKIVSINGMGLIYGDGSWGGENSGYGNCVCVSNDNFESWYYIEDFDYKVVQDMAYYNQKFIIIFEDSIMISTDLMNWQRIENEKLFYKIQSGNNKLMGISSNDIYYSGNGINWFNSNDIHKLEKENEGMYLITDNFIPNEPNKRHIIKESFTSTNWQSIPTLENEIIMSICYSPDHDIYVASTSSDHFLYSHNGIDWKSTPVPNPTTDGVYFNIAYGNGIFTSCIPGYCAYSYDGVNWYGKEFTMPEDGSYGEYIRIVYGDNKFVGIGDISSYGDFFSIYSYDGINWIYVSQENSELMLPSSGIYESLIYHNGIYIVADYLRWGYSYDGINWYPVVFPEAQNARWITALLHSMSYGNGKYVSVAGSQTCISEDGINWFAYNPIDILIEPWSIAYGNGKFLVLGQGEATVASSIDGINWEIESYLNNNSIEEIVYAGNKFFAFTPYHTLGVQYKLDYSALKFEDELTIFSSTIDVEGDSESNHPEGSYYVVYEDNEEIEFSIKDLNMYITSPETTWEEWLQTPNGINSGLSINPQSQEIIYQPPATYVVVDEFSTILSVTNNLGNTVLSSDIITSQEYTLTFPFSIMQNTSLMGVYRAETGMTIEEWCNSIYSGNDSQDQEFGSDNYNFWWGYSDADFDTWTTSDYNSSSIITSGETITLYPWCCFVEGTQIATSLDGETQSIETLKEGDLVISYNTDTKENYYTKIKKLVTNSHSVSMAKVYLDNGTILDMTDYHPLYTIEGFKSITDKRYPKLEIGDILPTFDNKETIITNIELYKNENPITTYTLNVIDLNENIDDDTTDNYYANGIIAHNVGCWAQ